MNKVEGFEGYNHYRLTRKRKYLDKMRPVISELISNNFSVNSMHIWLRANGYTTVTGKELSPMSVWKLLDDLGLKTNFSNSSSESKVLEKCT